MRISAGEVAGPAGVTRLTRHQRLSSPGSPRECLPSKISHRRRQWPHPTAPHQADGGHDRAQPSDEICDPTSMRNFRRLTRPSAPSRVAVAVAHADFTNFSATALDGVHSAAKDLSCPGPRLWLAGTERTIWTRRLSGSSRRRSSRRGLLCCRTFRHEGLTVLRDEIFRG